MTDDTLLAAPRDTVMVEGPPPFRAPYAAADETLATAFLAEATLDPESEARIDARATRLVTAVRARPTGLGGVEDLLQHYALSTTEGLALMVLAESLLRVPDSATADRLIEDRLADADFRHKGRSPTLFASASGYALDLSARILGGHEAQQSRMDHLVARIGRPAVRAAVRQAVRLIGSHFVYGETIGEALDRSAKEVKEAAKEAKDSKDKKESKEPKPQRLRWSFDVLAEGARTAVDAERYAAGYAAALDAIAARTEQNPAAIRPGLSIKLSALHPRHEAIARRRVLTELVPRLGALARSARAKDIAITVDAEEADRLELSLDVFEAVLADPMLAGWDGMGLAVQAYQKRAGAVIDWVADLAERRSRRIAVRLVKGAYWDTEIKRAQERGLADFPVFTRKAMTDLSFVACARKLLELRPLITPQIATHNALTIATVIELAGGTKGYEFQRLHGMGEALYAALLAEEPDATCRVYAPVGEHKDLLAYLVRRLLENGANSSFVTMAGDPAVPIDVVLNRPQALVATPARARNAKIALPTAIHPERRTASGVEFGHADSLAHLVATLRLPEQPNAAPVIDGTARAGRVRPALSPNDGLRIGSVTEADDAAVDAALSAALAGFPAWDRTPVETRAATLARAADAIEAARGPLMALLQAEGGKTLDDALAEVRETIDLVRYYAAGARKGLATEVLPGPTGESNELRYRGRGVFVCISPWNFPLAIFVGQIAAALVAGNTVVAKPAEQSPLTAAYAVKLLHGAGVPVRALHFVPGDSRAGALLVRDPQIAGVAFTGSTDVARAIYRTLAGRGGPIVPLIAETGGINAMIADATALPEQLTDDVITSAFRSAGQRCSSLRLLCVQDDVAEPILAMLAGAARELVVGDPREISTNVGPVIDAEARTRLLGWLARKEKQGRVLFRADRVRPLPESGTFVPPAIVTLDRARDLREEVFGPILHVVKWKAGALDDLLDDIAETGYGLTVGVQSRIGATVERVVERLSVGNVYVDRNMIGAVVGTQPFGGVGLSGTGPKAGGPNYLRRFAQEQTVTINTAALGGNVGLVSQSEE